MPASTAWSILLWRGAHWLHRGRPRAMPAIRHAHENTSPGLGTDADVLVGSQIKLGQHAAMAKFHWSHASMCRSTHPIVLSANSAQYVSVCIAQKYSWQSCRRQRDATYCHSLSQPLQSFHCTRAYASGTSIIHLGLATATRGPRQHAWQGYLTGNNTALHCQTILLFCS